MFGLDDEGPWDWFLPKGLTRGGLVMGAPLSSTMCHEGGGGGRDKGERMTMMMMMMMMMTTTTTNWIKKRSSRSVAELGLSIQSIQASWSHDS